MSEVIGAGDRELTLQECFDDMYGTLAEAGAVIHAVEGTVVTESGVALRAVYRITEMPPTITQIIATGHANLTATVTHIGMSAAQPEMPLIGNGRYTHDLSSDPDAVFRATVSVPMRAALGPQAEDYLLQAYGNVLSFQK